MTRPPPRRRAEELAIELAALSGDDRGGGGGAVVCCGFHCGAGQGLGWLCHGGHGPLTGESSTRPVSPRALAAELTVAWMLLYRRPSPHRDFAGGLHHALLWAQSPTMTPPGGCRCTVAPGNGPPHGRPVSEQSDSDRWSRGGW